MTYVDMPQAEFGRCADIEFIGDEVIKTAKWPMAYEEAEQQRQTLVDYAAALDDEPIHVGKLLSTAVVNLADGYHVQHTAEVVHGPSVLRLPPEERQAATASMIAGVAAMQTVDGPDRLVVGIDAPAKNWHVNEDDEPVLIDLYPPLVRDINGELQVGRVAANFSHFEQYMGTKSGVISKILYSALNPDYSSASALERAGRLVHRVDDWCYDTMPAEMDPTVRDAVQSQLKSRFVPFLASVAVRMARSKLHSIM